MHFPPQLKAENMYNLYSGINDRIFKEKNIFQIMIIGKF